MVPLYATDGSCPPAVSKDASNEKGDHDERNQTASNDQEERLKPSATGFDRRTLLVASLMNVARIW